MARLVSQPYPARNAHIRVHEKKRPFFFVIYPIKLARCSRNLAHRFLNKFVSKRCKRFPPYLKNVSTPPCETWNAYCANATVELLQKETPEFIPPLLWPQIWIQLMWVILQQTVYKTCITALELSTTTMTNGFHNYDMAQLGPLRSQSLFQFVHISDAFFVHLLLQ